MKPIYILTQILIICLSGCSKESSIKKPYKEEVNIQKQKISTDVDESIIIGNKIIQFCDNDSIVAHAYANRGSAYSNKGNYIQAFNDVFKAKEMFNIKQHNLSHIVYNNISLSNIYKRIGLTDRAIMELNETLEFIKKNDSNNYLLIATVYMAEGNVLVSLSKPEASLLLFNKAEKYLKMINGDKLLDKKKRLLAINYSDISNVYLAKNNYLKAEFFINKAKDILENNDEFNTDYINTLTLAEIFAGTKRENEAIKLLLPLKSNVNIEPVFKQFIHELLSQSYINIGNYQASEKEKEEAEKIQTTFNNQKIEGIKEAYRYIEDQLYENELKQNRFKIFICILIITFLTTIFILARIYAKKIKIEKNAYNALIASIDNNTKKPKVKIEDKEEIEYSSSELLLLEKLKKFEEDKGFLIKNLTLAVMAVELNTNTYYLSEIINKSKSKNLNTYINELRINYIVKELYERPELLAYKISYIADLAGFNSHNSFSIIFKKITNISPSVFIESRRKDNLENS